LALYAWALFIQPGVLTASLIVTNAAAIAAGTAFFYGVVIYLFVPRDKMTPAAIIGYLLIIAMVALLIKDTGYLASPFIALWMLTGLFAAVFGLYGAAPMVAGVVIYLATLELNHSLDFNAIALSSLLGLLPLALGYLIWRPIGHSQVPRTAEDRSLGDLTDQLDAVSGQSEIVIAAIADGVISLDAKGTIQLINPAAQHMLGWVKSDAVGLDYKSVLKLLDSRDNEPNELNDPINQALHKHVPTKTDNFRLQTADSGKSFIASITTNPIGEAGSGAIIVFRDITNENEEERQRAEFISTASHEMRTPVASIEGYLGLALNPATATVDAKARDYIGKAQDAAKHLGRLFQDLLDVSKADDGRLSDNPAIIDLVPFVHDIIVGQLPAAQAKGLEVKYPPQPEFLCEPTALDGEKDGPAKTLSPVFYVNVDPDHLREIVSNLIENAIKYTPKGSINIDVTAAGESVVISVHDSGIGIPKEDQPHLFQKFYRVDNTDTREIGGTGLGLYLSRRLAEAIGGNLWVESIYKEGSTFFLKLPRLESAEAERILSEQAAKQPTPKPHVPVAMPAAVQATLAATQAAPAPAAPTTTPAAPTQQATSPVPQPVASQPQAVAPAQQMPTVVPQPLTVPVVPQRPQPTPIAVQPPRQATPIPVAYAQPAAVQQQAQPTAQPAAPVQAQPQPQAAPYPQTPQTPVAPAPQYAAPAASAPTTQVQTQQPR